MPFPIALHLELPPLDAVAGIDDEALLDLIRRWSEARRTVDAGLAALAGELAARSRPDAGITGLAQRSGDRTPDALLARMAGTTTGEASALVSVGRILADPPPWLSRVVSRVGDGEMSVPVADAIRRGLGSPTPDVAADDLADAVVALASESEGLTAEQAGRRAREARDDLDARGVADRERVLREKRSLRMFPQRDGTTRLVAVLDPESAAIVSEAIDLVTAPRRGGPRSVDAEAGGRARHIIDDERTTDQLALDALVELVRIAGRADDGRIYAARKPSVRVHVTLGDLAGGVGAAWLEGQRVATSIATAERIACAEGWQGMLFDDHAEHVLQLGRTQRLFSSKQRDALAAVWGGCGAEECDRPPSWCEAHHIDEWHRDGGSTDVDAGILLCRHHHLLIHNEGLKIVQRDDGSRVAVRRDPHGGDSSPGEIVRLRFRPKNPVRERRRRELADA